MPAKPPVTDHCSRGHSGSPRSKECLRHRPQPATLTQVQLGDAPSVLAGSLFAEVVRADFQRNPAAFTFTKHTPTNLKGASRGWRVCSRCVIDRCEHGRRHILDAIGRLDLKVTHILVTHAHGDHVGALREVSEATGADVCCGRGDMPLLKGHGSAGAQPVEDGWATTVGRLKVRALALPGHTPGGTAYATDQAVFSGDALFAGSLGGAAGEGYLTQIQAVRTKVLSLGGDVRIFPGHGPITTVGEEQSHNPFIV